MITIDLNGKEVNWKPHARKRQQTSQLHANVREFLHSAYPTVAFIEEVGIPVRRGQTLYLDFFSPLLNLAVEAHGEQHYKFVQHFHGSRMNWARHRRRDAEKKEWCENNNITIIELPFDETNEQWLNRINSLNE